MISFLLISCDNEKPISLSFEELPSDVRIKFIEVYNTEYPKITNVGDTLNSPPFVECYNLNPSLNCKIDSEGGIISNPFFVFESDKRKTKISWAVLQRVFIIKNDTIYYPISKSGLTQYRESRAKFVKIDTLTFESKKMY